MKIQIIYDSDRIDIFDTTNFTAQQPFATTNMLTNFELRVDELGGHGLWLAAHYYDVSPAYREETEPDDVPVARRRKGWRFLLASADEVGHIVGVFIDDAPVLRRAGGELVNYARIEQCASNVLGAQPAALYPRIIALNGFFERLHGKPKQEIDPDSIAHEFGLTGRTVSRIESEWQAHQEQRKEIGEVWPEKKEEDEGEEQCGYEDYDEMDGEDYEDD